MKPRTLALSQIESAVLAGLIAISSVAGCGKTSQSAAPVDVSKSAGPHGGKLIVVGDRRFLLEFLYAPLSMTARTNALGKISMLKEEQGTRLDMYLLDAAAKSPVTCSNLTVQIVAKSLMGDQVLEFQPIFRLRDPYSRFGSLFQAKSEWISQQDTIEGRVKQIQIGREIFVDIPFHVSRREL